MGWILAGSTPVPGVVALDRTRKLGPERDFYFPETWLNFGLGKTNTVVMNLPLVAKGVRKQSARVVPDRAYGEYREEKAIPELPLPPNKKAWTEARAPNDWLTPTIN
jgi:hypothetical protein